MGWIMNEDMIGWYKKQKKEKENRKRRKTKKEKEKRKKEKKRKEKNINTGWIMSEDMIDWYKKEYDCVMVKVGRTERWMQERRNGWHRNNLRVDVGIMEQECRNDGTLD